jgi:hypothetical protein
MTTNDLLYAFAPFIGKNRNDDGTLTVYGKITGPDLDADGQRMDPKWLAKAVPDWFEIGNIREMHQPNAVGKATTLEQDGDDWHISAKIVDPVSVLKCENDVLTGFSIGIRGPRLTKSASAPNGVVIGGTIIETSLADRASNGTCKMMLAKAVGVDDQLVHVEEFIEKADGVAVGVDGSVTDETGAETSADETGEETAETDLIVAARAALVALVGGEVDELAEGGSLGPVRILIALLDDLAWFAECDMYDDAAQAAAALIKSITTHQEAPDVLELSTFATLVKAATAEDATPEASTDLDEIRKALGLDDLTTTIDKSIAKATKATEERLTTLEADIAKALALPEPGGPVLAHGQSGIEKATSTEVDRLEKLAATCTDPTLSAGYLTMAAELRSGT